MSRSNGNTIALCIFFLCSVFAIWIGASINAKAQTQHQNNPTLKETLRWMQTSLENGGGDYEVGHEVRSVKLDDFDGCKVHFSASTHQEPFMNGEPAPDKRPTRIDYFFNLGDIDPTNLSFTRGPRVNLSARSLITIHTRNDEKKIMSRYSWSEADSKPDDTFIIFALDAIENDYVDRFARAFKHAVETCGGKPSFFTGSNRQDSDKPSSHAAGGTAAQSAAPNEPLDLSDGIEPKETVEPAPRLARPRKDIPTIAKAANGAIVSIIMSDKDGHAIAQGTGFLVSKDGHIVTNYHVIENGSSATIKFPDGALFAVDGVLASDKARDVAVIKAHGENFRTLTVGNSDKLQVGEDVVAIGNPLSLESTVSNGIVSGIRTSEEKGGKFLQVTTPISPGSSGGPLFNMAGEVVGITTLYLEGGENLNFAIPINDAKHLLLARSPKIQALPNEPEPIKPQRHDGDAHSSARDYYQQLYDAGGFSEDLPAYVCFIDDDQSGTFLTFRALAYDEYYGTTVQKKAPYVTFMPRSVFNALPSDLQKFFRTNRALYLDVYNKGVKGNMVEYDWNQDEGAWFLSTIPADANAHSRESAVFRLSIEPATMRFSIIEISTLTVGRDVTAATRTDRSDPFGGVCEKVPSPK